MRAHPALSTKSIASILSILAAGRAALETGDSRTAIELLTPAIQDRTLAPDDEALLRCLLSEALVDAGRETKAFKTIAKYHDPMERSRLSRTSLCQVLNRLGHACISEGNPANAIEHLTQASNLADDLSDRMTASRARLLLCRSHRVIGQFTKAREYAKEALGFFEELDSKRNLSLSYTQLGAIDAHIGNYPDALRSFRLAEELLEPTCDLLPVAHVNANIAMVYLWSGEFLLAKDRMRKSLELFERLGHPRHIARSKANLAETLFVLGEWGRALVLLIQAIEENAKHGNRWPERGAAEDSLGKLLTHRGAYEEAHKHLDAAFTIAKQIGHEWNQIDTLLNLAELHRLTGQFDQANNFVDMALSASRHIGHTEFVVQCRLAQASIALDQEDSPTAMRILWEAEEMLPNDQNLPIVAHLQLLKGRLASARGDHEEARHLLLQSVSAYETVKDRYRIGISNVELASALLKANQLETAKQYAERALEIFTDLQAEPARRQASRILDESRLMREDAEGFRTPRFSPPSAKEHTLRRLIEASSSREFLLRELVSITAELSHAPAVILFSSTHQQDLQPLVWQGCSQSEVRAFKRAVTQALNGARKELLDNHSFIFVLRPVSMSEHFVLYLKTDLGVVDLEAIRSLKLALKLAERALESVSLRERMGEAWQPVINSADQLRELPGFVVAGPATRSTLTQVSRVAHSDVPVLITGESGTGKELIALAIHLQSSRSDKPFVPFNCAAINREIFESQLFGHRRGSFTGAVTDSLGIVRAADGGTLFLDEIGDMDLSIQPKLLRFLQEGGEVFPVGEKQPINTNVRVIAATNRFLEGEVRRGAFREDLYYRLNILRIDVPPLRQRRDEIPGLISYYLAGALQKARKQDVCLGKEAVDLMCLYDWPGNVRELRAEIERLVLYSDEGEVIGATKLSPQISMHKNTWEGSGDTPIGQALSTLTLGNITLDQAVDELERRLIVQTLQTTGGNITQTARQLKLSIQGLKNKLKRLGINRASLIS